MFFSVNYFYACVPFRKLRHVDLFTTISYNWTKKLPSIYLCPPLASSCSSGWGSSHGRLCRGWCRTLGAILVIYQDGARGVVGAVGADAPEQQPVQVGSMTVNGHNLRPSLPRAHSSMRGCIRMNAESMIYRIQHCACAS